MSATPKLLKANHDRFIRYFGVNPLAVCGKSVVDETILEPVFVGIQIFGQLFLKFDLLTNIINLVHKLSLFQY